MKPFFPILIKSIAKHTKSEQESTKTKSGPTLENREILEDVMLTQLKMTRVYNDCAACCENQNFRADMLNILKDNFDLFSKEFDEAQKRGWVTPGAADPEEIETLKAKYQTNG